MVSIIVVTAITEAILWTALAVLVTKANIGEVWPLSALALIISAFSYTLAWFAYVIKNWYGW